MEFAALVSSVTLSGLITGGILMGCVVAPASSSCSKTMETRGSMTPLVGDLQATLLAPAISRMQVGFECLVPDSAQVHHASLDTFCQLHTLGSAQRCAKNTTPLRSAAADGKRRRR